jgi:hypothetical protein
MSDNSRDPMEDYLQTPRAPSADPPWRGSLLQRTQCLLQARQRRRRLALATALVACFAAGALVVWLSRPAPPDRPDVPQANQSSQQPTPLPPVAPSSTGPLDQAVEKEWQAFDGAANRALLLREAGDHYFHDAHDFASALRCYRQALDSAAGEELTHSDDDNWLVMALKIARRKEKTDEANRN